MNVLRLLVFASAVSLCHIGLGQEAAPAKPPSVGRPATADEERFFEERVRPVLAKRCFGCHGQKKQEAGLRLDVPALLLRGSENGPILRADDLQQSRLIAVLAPDADLQMPPDEEIPRDEAETIIKWVTLGAPIPAALLAASAEGDHGLSSQIARARATHWSLQPIERPALPEVREASWSSHPVDRFILARLESAGLSPSLPADPYRLIRRVTFDLTGLPPMAEEVEAFQKNPSADAYADVVDRLLASPQYGQRWGRHWLDVARYADTRGYSLGRERRFAYAYTYRDYVICALNEDKPFDEFIVEQLAADLLPQAEDKRPLAALGFLTVGRRFINRHDTLDDRIDVVTRGLLGLTVTCARCHDHKYDPIVMDDYYALYGVFASTHEPKQLPLLAQPEDTKEYRDYKTKLDQLNGELQQFDQTQHAALLEDVRTRVADYLVRAASQEKAPDGFGISVGRKDLKPRVIARWRDYLKEHVKADDPIFGPWHALSMLPQEEFSEKGAALLERWNENGAGDSFNGLVLRALAQSRPQSMPDVARTYGRLLLDIYRASKNAPGTDDVNTEEPNTEQTTSRQTSTSVQAVDSTTVEATEALKSVLLAESTPTAITLAEAPRYYDRPTRGKRREMQRKVNHHEVHSDGAPPRPMMLADNATPHQPKIFLRGNPARPDKEVPRQFVRLLSGADSKPFDESGSGRLELARAIVAGDNPLTARVMVNRVWMHHFGTPLVATPSDFGLRSDEPTHPELLDYLAWRFRTEGWSLKSLHRLLVLSETYQQASLSRPEGVAKDQENRLYWKMNQRRLELEAMRDAVLAVAGQLDLALDGRPVDLLSQPFTTRRTVYGFVDRQDLPDMFRIFDFASPDATSPGRPRTTVPQQALFLMNSDFMARQAQHLAARNEVVTSKDARAKVNALYRLVLARQATPEEIQLGLDFLSAAEAADDTGPAKLEGGKDDGEKAPARLSPWEKLAQVLLLTNEFTFVD